MFRLLPLALGLSLSLPALGNAAILYYQEGFTDRLSRFDTTTATNTFVGNMGGQGDSWGFAFNPTTGDLYGLHRASTNLYRINTSTAALTLVGTTGISAEDLTFDLAGTTLYASFSNQLFAINPLSGSAVSVGGISTTLDALTTAPVPVTVQGFGVVAAGTIFGVDTGSLYIVNLAGPSLSLVGSVPADEAMDFDANGSLIGHNDAALFSRINLSNLSSVGLGNSSSSLVFALAVQPTAQAVPEPASMSIVLAGLIGGGMLGCRRRKTTPSCR